MSQLVFDRWMTAIQKVGFPVVAASALGWVLWAWGDRAITSHVKFVDGMLVVERQNSETLRIHALAAEQSVILLNAIKHETAATAEGVEQTKKELQKLNHYLEGQGQ